MSILEKLKNKNYSLDTIGKSDSKVLIFDDSVLKIQKNDLVSQNELQTLLFLEKQNKIITPKIIDSEVIDNQLYILMTKIQNDFFMACDDFFLSNQNLLCNFLAQTLKLTWSLKISDCPSCHNLETKLLQAKYNVENNLIDINDCQQETFSTETKNGRFKNPQELLNFLIENKSIVADDEKVFSHGDFCLPNIFLQKTNNFSCGFIDVGRAGILDKWNDIAICYRSLKDNTSGMYGRKAYKNFDVNLFFKELDIQPDWNKIDYYILLDELF